MPGCVDLSHLAKYRNRPSPPYPANFCRHQKKRGNDGRMWRSTRNSNGVFSWKPDAAKTARQRVPVEHRIRVSSSAKLPRNLRGVLASAPPNWRSKSPFDHTRTWPDGTLPSFKKLGAIGSFAFGGGVIYSQQAYNKAQKMVRTR